VKFAEYVEHGSEKSRLNLGDMVAIVWLGYALSPMLSVGECFYLFVSCFFIFFIFYSKHFLRVRRPTFRKFSRL